MVSRVQKGGFRVLAVREPTSWQGPLMVGRGLAETRFILVSEMHVSPGSHLILGAAEESARQGDAKQLTPKSFYWGTPGTSRAFLLQRFPAPAHRTT